MRSAFGAIAATLAFLLLSTPALAGPPTHLRKEALDISGFNHACGTATDNKGDVYVASAGESKIKVFDAEHNLLTSIANLNEPCGLAVDRYGTLFVNEKATGKVVRYVPNAYPFAGTPTYGAPETIDSSGAAKGIAVDSTVPSDLDINKNEVVVRGNGGNLYVAKGDHIDAYANEAQRLRLPEATAGSFKLTFKGQTTPALPYNSSHAAIQAALEVLSTIGAGNVAVTGARKDSHSGGQGPKGDHLITFVHNLGLANLSAIELDKSGLTGANISISTETEGGRGLNEVQGVRVGANTTAGSFKLTFSGQTTAAIPYNATAAEVQSALEALSNIAPGDVLVSATSGSNEYAVEFLGAYASTDVPQLEKTSALTPDEVQKVTVNATAGSFKLTFSGQTTAAIPYNASAAEVQSALEALSNIAPGDVSVTGGPGGPGGATPYLVTFTGAYAGTDVAQMSASSVGLTGSVSVATTTKGANVSISTSRGGWNGQLGNGALTSATGVAAYTYQSEGFENVDVYLFVADASSDEVKIFSGPSLTGLKLRKTIDSVDQDRNPATPEQEIGFGAAGASLAVDPGNGNPATNRCESPVAQQACTAGHFVLYDDASGTVDEFEANGEFLDQISNPEFDDGEPTGLAIERSGGPNDGTIYVTAGTGAAAKLLAFGPLAAPSRAPLPELSHVLSGARAVAVDSHGNVYVAATTKIHVYGPDGTKLSEFEDAEIAIDLAVDSTGKVYAVDGFSSERKLTYYTPAAYPPVSGTAYSRHEPPLQTEEARIERVTVNPANDHVLVGVGLGGEFSKKIVELGSAKEGSPLNGVIVPFFSFPNTPTGLAVHRSNGKIYATDDGRLISVIAASGTELAAQIGGAGSLNGINSGSSIDVEQSSGHAVDFKPESPAQEYDASGGFVAEFGVFSGASNGDVAVDNSCALHRSGSGEPEPLNEATTPTCKEFDPANGNVYVTADGNNNEIQPYDVTAFGPLAYGEPPSPVTGEAGGFGAGNATLHGTVDPRGFDLEECRFEYLSDAEYLTNGKTFAGATSAPCAETPAEIGKGTGAVAVHVDLGGLDPEGRYRYRLVAKNKYGEVPGEAGLFGAPVLIAKSALPVAYDEATLRAEIDPSGLTAKYHFEYGTDESYGQSTPVGELLSGDGPVAIKAPITGLEEGTEYHFRLLAENEALSVKGPDQVFTTLKRRPAETCPNTEYRIGFSANLPDCRAYELVTPAETRGADTSTQSSKSGQPYMNSWFITPRGAGAGENVAFEVFPSLPGFDGAGGGDNFRGERGEGAHPASGWSVEPYGLSFAQTGGSVPGSHGVSSDQRYWLTDVLAHSVPVAETFALGHYLRVPTGQAAPECSPDPKLEFERVGCAGATDLKAEGRFVSAGGGHLVFTSKAQLEEEAAPSGTEAIYDRPVGSSEAEVVSVKPDSSPFEAGEGATYIAATEDGTAVVFKAGGVLYLHRGGTTIEVAAVPNAYAGISADGKRVFYIEKEFNSAGFDGPPPAALFACDIETGPCAGAEATHAPIQIASNSVFVNVSADGSHAFFTSEDALTGAEENENGETAQTLANNLYAWDGSSVKFIALLDPQDLIGWQGEGLFAENHEDLLQWTNGAPGQGPGAGAGREFSPTRSTPDGEVLVFQSHAQFGGYENEGHGEIYRYAPNDAPGNRLSCVSCDPSGAPASADALLQSFGPNDPTRPNTLIPNLTDDGKAVFLQTRNALLPEDANSATDVYQWKAAGAGSCEAAGGCLALISSGQGEGDSKLFGMSADGHDVFIVTTDKLVGADVKASPSLYDARVEGGIPDRPVKAPCQGDACQGAGSVPPALQDPASARLGEGGNVSGEEEATQTRCGKGQRKVRRAGKTRCVKKHHKRHRVNRNRRAGR